jgi:hypothetical protein
MDFAAQAQPGHRCGQSPDWSILRPDGAARHPGVGRQRDRRKAFDLSSNAWLELQWVLFSMVFLFCAPWTLQLNEHVRIDIVNSMMPMARAQHD